MSTEDDRPRHPGDYASGGSFSRGAETYHSSGYGSPERNGGSSNYFDPDDYSTEPTSVLPGPGAYDAYTEDVPVQQKNPWHPGADLGLLVLRLVLGALFVGHGLQHLFGWFQGRGLAGMADQLAHFGFSNGTILAWVTGLTELVGGTFVALGLFTPAGAAAILAVTASAIAVKFNVSVFIGGVELEAIYAAAAFAVLFAGPGRVSLDRPTPWYRNAWAFGVVFFLLAAAASVTMLLVFR